MKWQKLDKESIESLKTGNYILVCGDNADVPIEVIKFLDLSDCYYEDGVHDHWYCLSQSNSKTNPRETCCDDILLDCYTHFCIITEPDGLHLVK
jgi:hypothetical protein